MDKKEAKLKAASFLNAVQDAVTNPKVLKTSKIAKKTLDIAALLAQSKLTGPLSVAGAALSSLDAIHDVLELPKDRFAREYNLQHKLIPTESKIPLILERLGLFHRLEKFHEIMMESRSSLKPRVRSLRMLRGPIGGLQDSELSILRTLFGPKVVMCSFFPITE